MTPLATVASRRRALDRARSAFNNAIRDAVKADAPKGEVAKAAGISRPTLYAILNR